MDGTPGSAPPQMSDKASHESSVQKVPSEAPSPDEANDSPLSRLLKDVLAQAQSSPGMDGSRIQDLVEVLKTKPESSKRTTQRSGSMVLSYILGCAVREDFDIVPTQTDFRTDLFWLSGRSRAQPLLPADLAFSDREPDKLSVLSVRLTCHFWNKVAKHHQLFYRVGNYTFPPCLSPKLYEADRKQQMNDFHFRSWEDLAKYLAAIAPESRRQIRTVGVTEGLDRAFVPITNSVLTPLTDAWSINDSARLACTLLRDLCVSLEVFWLVVDMRGYSEYPLSCVVYLLNMCSTNTAPCFSLLRGLRRFDVCLSGYWSSPPSPVVVSLGETRAYPLAFRAHLHAGTGWAANALNTLKEYIMRHAREVRHRRPDHSIRTADDYRELRHLVRLTGVFVSTVMLNAHKYDFRLISTHSKRILVLPGGQVPWPPKIALVLGTGYSNSVEGPRVAGAVVQFTTSQEPEHSVTIFRWIPFSPWSWSMNEIRVLYQYELQKLNTFIRMRRSDCRTSREPYQGCFGITHTLELSLEIIEMELEDSRVLVLHSECGLVSVAEKQISIQELEHMWNLFCILCLRYVQTLGLSAADACRLLPERARAKYERQTGLWTVLPRFTY
ncbi:hypothetical protein CONLIGDRAFT_696315 [Coniochaeta ligniaria NRRL 30616]|uniref:F-box domain-containing protein n=1 Tax=Coniochaeta ligniaria NRRL 30616 TaxID=1408157 RepID=A0A1J7J2Y7_9PEZI|nr:hypothetical protein CONLIGDRAFT_696315 [Coniochaeta ligniaria NRRL 30616]